MGLIEASLARDVHGHGWHKRRKIDPVQRWRLHGAAVHLSSMGLPRRHLTTLNLIAKDRNLWSDCPEIKAEVSRPFLAIMSPHVLMENYKAACSRQTAACKSCAPMYVVFDGAYIKACSDVMGKGIAAAHQLKPGVCGGKWNSDPDKTEASTQPSRNLTISAK